MSLGVTAHYEVEEKSMYIQQRWCTINTFLPISCYVFRGAVSVDIHPAWNQSDVFSGNDIAIITLDRWAWYWNDHQVIFVVQLGQYHGACASCLFPHGK